MLAQVNQDCTLTEERPRGAQIKKEHATSEFNHRYTLSKVRSRQKGMHTIRRDDITKQNNPIIKKDHMSQTNHGHCT